MLPAFTFLAAFSQETITFNLFFKRICFQSQDQGADNALDSDADVTTGQTACTELVGAKPI